MDASIKPVQFQQVNTNPQVATPPQPMAAPAASPASRLAQGINFNQEVKDFRGELVKDAAGQSVKLADIVVDALLSEKNTTADFIRQRCFLFVPGYKRNSFLFFSSKVSVF